MKKSLILALFIVLNASIAVGADRMNVKVTIIDPNTMENRQKVGDVLTRAAVLASRRYERYFTAEYDADSGKFDYTVEVIASLSGTSSGVFLAEKDGNEQSISFLGEFNDSNVGYIATVYASLWNTYTGGFAGELSSPPVLVDVLPTATLLKSVPGLQPVEVGSAMAFSGTVKSNGNVLLAFGSFAAELSPEMRVVNTIGLDLRAKGNYTSAGGVFTTPADTVFLKPSMGRQALKIVDGSSVFQPVNLGMDPFGPFTVLHDGSIAAIDSTSQRAVLITNGRPGPLDIKTNASSYISYLGTGPGGNIWSWDMIERQFRIFTKDGVLAESAIPITSASEYLAPMAFTIYPDGSYLLFVSGAAGFELRRYARNGVLRWKLNELQFPFPEPMPNNLAMAFDPENAYLYILDTMGKRVIRMFDSSWAEERGIKNSHVSEIIKMNQQLISDPYNAELFRKKAEVYIQRGAVELAIAAWNDVLVANPYDADARDQVIRLETQVMRVMAQAETEKTFAVLDQFGPASAQLQYMTTLQIYEQILNLAPDDDATRKEMDNLMRKFQARNNPEPPRLKPARIAGVELSNLFPSLMLSYVNNPVGAVSVLNTTGIEMSDVKASVFIEKYMDFPVESEPVDVLPVSAETNLNLRLLFNRNVLKLQEDLPIQVRIEITYLADGEVQRLSKGHLVTLYRNTALSWDYSGKLASFIMPNEEVVKNFASNVLIDLDVDPDGLPDKMVRAAKLCDAVGAYGIAYIEDPASPFSRILGKSEIIDTVRFPRVTLQYRSGDCDDTTALLGSLLEASGIGTAIMTSPGHVFLAFNTGEPAENRWLFESDQYGAIVHSGTVWIPIETTTLSEGFVESWRIASALVRDNPNEIEFLPVIGERDLYPPLPLEEITSELIEPQPSEINRLLNSSIEGAVDILYNTGISSLESNLAQASGRKELKVRNQLGVLHARFGRTDQAISAFEENMAQSPTYTASYLNLANLLVSERKSDEAVIALRSGLEQNPVSPTLNLLLARIYHANNQYALAWRYFDEVKERSPDLAERFAYLGNEGDATRRAGIEWEDLPLLWDEGDE
ncbi:MAG: tetratricopeptide repeat protein [Spirochaetales bacterium]|nr:tetratricopeptide repeat protein [Spirochaetales bacterium]